MGGEKAAEDDDVTTRWNKCGRGGDANHPVRRVFSLLMPYPQTIPLAIWILFFYNITHPRFTVVG
jgi:hypothetical protein